MTTATFNKESPRTFWSGLLQMLDKVAGALIIAGYLYLVA